MPDLTRTLQSYDLGLLKMIAAAWGGELTAPTVRAAALTLSAAMQDPALTAEVVAALPTEARAALEALLEAGGQLSWAVFTRRFGEVRAMGAARRDRERPDLHPVSPAELLWYRALIGRAFANLPPEPQEVAYIPPDLPIPGWSGAPAAEPAAQPTPAGLNLDAVLNATPVEAAIPLPATDRILDHAATLLAARRVGLEPPELPISGAALTPPALAGLLDSAGLLDAAGQPLPEAARAFLEAPRAAALAQLTAAWMSSEKFDELRLLPGLTAETAFKNFPRTVRHKVLDWVSAFPSGAWWSLAGLVRAVQTQQPDFQRPAGDYDSWFIRQDSTGQYLRGYASWDAVDGALLRWLITGPLHWLGLLDLAAPAEDAPPAAFRLSPWAADLWAGQPPRLPTLEDEPLRVTSDGLILATTRTPRAVRYQVARCCAWEPGLGSDYRYRVTPAALTRARTQGLKPGHLLALLRRHAAPPLPPTLIQALERWEQHGSQARLEGQVTLLRVESPAVIEALRARRGLGRWLGEALSPTILVIQPGGSEKVRKALLELGYLAEEA